MWGALLTIQYVPFNTGCVWFSLQRDDTLLTARLFSDTRLLVTLIIIISEGMNQNDEHQSDTK